MKLMHDEKGAVAIEFVIVLVLILIPLFIGLVDAAKMVNAQLVLDRAAREGAVCKMRNEPWQEPIKNVLRNANFDLSELVITEGAESLTLTYTIPNFPLFNLYRAVFSGQISSYATYQVP